MTPDLERAVAALQAMEVSPFTDADIVATTLRALENLSPEVLETMAKSIYALTGFTTPWRLLLDTTRHEIREGALASWRAGLNAILAAEGEDG